MNHLRTKAMRNKLVAILALIYFCALNTQLSTVFGQGSGFTYQGRLDDSGSPPNGSYDFILTVLDGGGSVVAGPLTNSPTLVTNGLFTVTLDFGSGAFTGADRWLEIAVRTNG